MSLTSRCSLVIVCNRLLTSLSLSLSAPQKINEQQTLHSKLNCPEKGQTQPQGKPSNIASSTRVEVCDNVVDEQTDTCQAFNVPTEGTLTSGKSIDQMEFLTIRDKSNLTKLSDSSRGSSSFDSIDYPLKVVKECMQRLEAKAKMEQEIAQKQGIQDVNYDQPVSPPSIDQVAPVTEDPLINPSHSMRSKLRLDDLTVAYKVDERATTVAMKPSFVKSISSEGDENIKLDLNRLLSDIDTVAINWQSSRNIFFTECSCGGQPFDLFAPKNHCYCCGKIYCARCTDRKLNLPGLESDCNDINNDISNSDGSSDVFESPSLLECNQYHPPDNLQQNYIDSSYLYQVPVCRLCYKLIREKDSLTSPSVEVNYKQLYSRNICQS